VRLQQQKPGAVPLGGGNYSPEALLGSQAAALESQGKLNGALKLLKEQEKILRQKQDLGALKINLMKQSAITAEDSAAQLNIRVLKSL